jgi:adenylate cyclase
MAMLGAANLHGARWVRPRRAGTRRTASLGVALVAVAVALLLMKLLGGGPLPESPTQHFYIVSAASLLAALVAGILAFTTIQIGLYRVLLVCLGFTTMGGIFAVHGLLTPGVVIPDRLEASAYQVVAMSAHFSLAVPAIFFAAGFAPGIAWLEKRLPFWPAGWLVVLTVVSITVYGAVALLNMQLLSGSALTSASFAAVLTVLTIVLLLFSALQQGRIYLTTGLQSQADLVFAFVLLAEAAAAMAMFEIWAVGWWFYHLLMLAAVCFALRALVIERLHRDSFKVSVEAALELGFEIPDSPG